MNPEAASVGTSIMVARLQKGLVHSTDARRKSIPHLASGFQAPATTALPHTWGRFTRNHRKIPSSRLIHVKR